MKSTICTALLAVTTATAVHAQDAKPRPEIGFRSGISFFRQEDQTVSIVSIPEGTFLAPSAVYFTFFPMPLTAVEPQVGFFRFGTESGSSGAVHLAVQVNQFVRDASADAPYGFLTGGFTSGFGSDGGSDTLWLVGGGAGYRMIVAETLGLRFEARYRRHQTEDDGLNEFSLLIGLGAIIGSN